MTRDSRNDAETLAHEPTFYVISTPIGNLEDMSARALRLLGELDGLACEDTRHTRKIFERFDLPRPKAIFSCHAHNEERVVGRILSILEHGGSVGLVSDAGSPGVSDPGQRAVAAVVEAGYRVEVVPGASAVTTALIASGLPAGHYSFLGFLPRRVGRQRKIFELYRDLPSTLVLFESPYRVGKILQAAAEMLGDRPAAVCVELTKLHERVYRGSLTELAEQFAGEKIKGEVTIVIAGPERGGEEDEEEGAEEGPETGEPVWPPVRGAVRGGPREKQRKPPRRRKGRG